MRAEALKRWTMTVRSCHRSLTMDHWQLTIPLLGDRTAASWPACCGCRVFRGPGPANAGDPGPRGSWHPLWASGGVDLDGDGHRVGDDVVDGRAGPGLLDDLAQLLGRGVALDVKRTVICW